MKRPILVLALLCLLPGCVSLQRSYPDKRFFAFDVTGPAQAARSGGRGTLQVADVRVSSRYSGKNFVYRLSDTTYETDFYNEFLVSPAALIAEELAAGLRRSGLFQNVIDRASDIQPDWVLEAVVDSLYGDFRNSAAAKAVLEMRVFVTNGRGSTSQIVLQKNYASSVPLDGRSPEALVNGWGRALEEILSELASDMERVQPGITAPAVSGRDKSGAAASR
jgi:cholesterol transport system auxiliary component